MNVLPGAVRDRVTDDSTRGLMQDIIDFFDFEDCLFDIVDAPQNHSLNDDFNAVLCCEALLTEVHRCGNDIIDEDLIDVKRDDPMEARLEDRVSFPEEKPVAPLAEREHDSSLVLVNDNPELEDLYEVDEEVYEAIKHSSSLA